MSQQMDSNRVDDVVFFVDEEGADFTFYLSRDKEDSVFSKVSWARLKERPGFPFAASPPGDEFSFCERVAIKRLEEIKNGFWNILHKRRREPHYAYLLEKLRLQANAKSQSPIQAERRKGIQARAFLRKLNAGNSVRGESKEDLRAFLAATLNDCIHQGDLREQPWFGSIFARLKKPQKNLIASLSDTEEKRLQQNLMLIERAFFPPLRRKLEKGRALICLSHNGKYLSVTFRKMKSGGGYEAKPSGIREQKKERKDHLFSIAEYCDRIYDQVINKTNSARQAHGLLVVTGPTNSAKSEIARGLIHKYLSDNLNSKENRRPHLLTFEDPIEKSYADDTIEGHPFVAVDLNTKSLGIDYTSRQKGKDVGGLGRALEDALRQTPAVFFVSETRDKKEWELLLDFAATGHLIVTTAHASSLVEAMHKIFEARQVKTPADRSEIANKLLGVIHLRSDMIVINNEKETTNALFPVLWRRTPRGVAALTSDGLASLLPHRPKENKSEGAPSCVGRRWLIERLIWSATHAEKKGKTNYLKIVFGNDFEHRIKTQAYKKAVAWDLEGV